MGLSLSSFTESLDKLTPTTTRNLREDYLKGTASLRPFYQYDLQQIDFSAIAADKSSESIDRELLAQVIREQYDGLALGEAVEQHLTRLAQPDSYTITTGHQLVLFGGPLFTVYKVLTIIKLAEQLSASSSGLNVVPIFWIHTEDHDFEEINHYYSGFWTKATYAGKFKGQVGNHVLDPSIAGLRPPHFSKELSETYRAGIPMKKAFRSFIHQLFGTYGLLILDADDPRLKAKFSGIIHQELSQQFAHQQVTQHSAALQAAGYPAQITPREINLFYLDEEGRNRITYENEFFGVKDRDLVFSANAMLELADQDPARFSPNVSLRPLYQEMILPNLAYIGGWGELSYWLQLRGVFKTAGVNFPLLLPRMAGSIFTANQAQEWSALGFDLLEIRKPLHNLYLQYLPQVWDHTNFETYQQEILALMESFKEYIASDISATLSRSAEALQTKTRNFLGNLEKKAGKVMRNRYPEPFQAIKRLKQLIEPDGFVQERTLSLASFSAIISPEQLIAEIYRQGDPLSFEHRCWVLPS